MVFFRCFKKHTMTILEEKDDEQEEGTTLIVHKPLVGSRAPLKVSKADDFLYISNWSSMVSCELSSFDSPAKIGEIVEDVLILNSSHHKTTDVSEPFHLLNHRIRAGQVQWGTNFKVSGEFSFTEFYWEWLEDILSREKKFLENHRIYNAMFASLFSYDRHAHVIRAFCEYWCPETNTLHTPFGELSISLWDMSRIAGLTIDGSFYDEVIPCTEELNGTGDDGRPLLPLSCSHLFLAYHQICHNAKSKANVKVADWIKFWYKGPSKYSKPPSKSARNKTQKPRDSHNPTGEIGSAREFTTEDLEVFETLGVKNKDINETYLAAFLACWLCKFVLPGPHANIIRPEVFKVASSMAHGHQFCLAIPVLASIYNGLNEISKSSDPGNNATVFPIHYVYGWLAEYFSTHFARSSWHALPRMTRHAGVLYAKLFDELGAHDLFKSSNNVVLDRLAPKHDNRRLVIDDTKLSSYNFEYFTSLRSSYLTLRQGGLIVIQPYSPHRFSRQFGFHQDVPGVLRKNVRTGSLDLMNTY